MQKLAFVALVLVYNLVIMDVKGTRVLFLKLKTWGDVCVFSGWVRAHDYTYARWLICVCINQLSPPPSLPVVYGSAAGRHISLPPFDGDTNDSWLLEAVCFHYASSSTRCSCITVSCKASKFWAEMRGKNFKRRVVFGAGRNKGAWFGYEEEKLKSG